jgi:release factor glutamine methyltransferase
MIYEPREDTYLMTEALSEYAKQQSLSNKKILELGCGNCYNAIFCAKQGGIVFGSDINEEAFDFGQNEANKFNVKISFIKSNMFDDILEKNFDIIFFNPPYLISDEIEDIALDGLEKGRHYIDLFIENFDKFITKKGIAFLLHTDYNDLPETIEKLKQKGFKTEIVKNLKLFFEELYILEITSYK